MKRGYFEKGDNISKVQGQENSSAFGNGARQIKGLKIPTFLN